MSRMGRPTDDPKTLDIRVRLSENDMQRLEHCAKVTGKKRAEIIREGIRDTYDRLNKK